MSDSETILRSILDQTPLETKQAFDTAIKDKIAFNLDDYKTHIAQQMLGVEPEVETAEVPEGDEEGEYDFSALTDEELDMLSNMSDEELEVFLKDVTDDEEETTEEQPEVGEEEQE
jgi:hypothetical protein